MKLKTCNCGGLPLLDLSYGYVKCTHCSKRTKAYRTNEKAVAGWNNNWTYYETN